MFLTHQDRSGLLVLPIRVAVVAHNQALPDEGGHVAVRLEVVLGLGTLRPASVYTGVDLERYA